MLFLMVWRADMLSIWIGVGGFCLYPDFFNTIHGYLAIFAATCAAINLASVELPVVEDWVLDLYITAPPQKIKTNPVVDQRFFN